MAIVLNLVRRVDMGGAAASTLNLLTGEGFDIEYYDGWMRSVAPDMNPYGNVVDTVNLIVSAADTDALATAIQKLDQKVQEASWYWSDIFEDNSVWLRGQLTDESQSYRALVREMSYEIGESIYSPYIIRGNVMRRVSLVINRIPFWECRTSKNHSDTGVSSIGGMADFTGTEVDGDIPGRMGRINFYEVGSNLTEVWAGFRSTRMGTLANFKPVWDLGLAAVDRDADTTRITPEATAYGGQYSRCAFTAVQTMLTRVSIEALDVAAGSSQRGEFTILLRAKVGANTTCYVQLADGYTGGSNWRIQSAVKIESNDWYLYPIGTVSFPATRSFQTNDLTKCRLRVMARRTAGTTLDMDCLIFVPSGEGSIYVNSDTAIGSEYLYTFTHPDGRIEASLMNSGTGEPIETCDVRPQRWGIPNGSVNLIVAAQRSASSILADTMSVSTTEYWRWRTLRGAEA